MSLRTDFILRALGEKTSFVELCREYGISPKTGYKWKERFLKEGLSGLGDRSRRPATSPNQLTEDVVCEIVRLKQACPGWGPRKIRDVYSHRHRENDLPSESSFKRILDKAGLVEKRTRRRSRDSGRLQTRAAADEPNDIWTVDFKGWWYTPEQERCEPLTVRDLFSRYVLCARPVENARTETVRREFERLFERYGLPQTIRSDNGRPFAVSTAPLGLSRLSAWWVALGIDLDRIDPGRPCQNGAHERMHRDLAWDIERPNRGDLKTQEAALATWRTTFNHERPHEALGMRRPAEIYTPSPRPYKGTPERLIYPSGYLQRRVQKAGTIGVDGIQVALTTALVGWDVGLRPLEPGSYSVHFGCLCLGRVDVATQSFEPLDSAEAEPPPSRGA